MNQQAATTHSIGAPPKPGPHQPRQPQFKVSTVLSLVLIVAIGGYIIAPLASLAIRAFAGAWYYPHLLPSVWSLKFWIATFQDANAMHSIVLSFLFAPIVTAVSAAVCLPAAYAFARRNFPLKRSMMMSLFAINSFPKMGLYIAIASLFYVLNIMGTFVGVVLIQMLNTLVLMTWIPSAAFASVPRSLEEAALDLGASKFTTFWRVTFPLARPGILLAVILTFLSSIDDAQGTFLVGLPKYITMPVRMYSLISNYPGAETAVFSILLALPSLVLLALVRKQLFSGTLASGYRLR